VERSYTISNIDKTCSSMASKAPRHAPQQRRMLVDMRIHSVNSWGPSSRRGNTTAWALRFARQWEAEARRRTRSAERTRASRSSRRRMAGGGEAWSTSRRSPPRASAAGVHRELLPVTTSPSACCRPPPRPGAARSPPLHGFRYVPLVSVGEMPSVLLFPILSCACVLPTHWIASWKMLNLSM
jgi:hypothetical protein